MLEEKDKNKRARASEKTAEMLSSSTFIRRLSRLYPIEIFPEQNELLIRVQLRRRDGKLVDVFDIPANAEGLVDAETAIDFIVRAWELALDDPIWKAAAKRLREANL